MRVLLVLLLSLIAIEASAQARPTSCPREGVARSDHVLDAFVNAALAARLQYAGREVTVWDGELVVCRGRTEMDNTDVHCVRAGQVDAVLGGTSRFDRNEQLVLVVPRARPTQIELWSIRPFVDRNRVRVVARARRTTRTTASSPFGSLPRAGRVLAAWNGALVTEGREVARYRADVERSGPSVDSVRIRGSRVLFFTAARSTTSVVVIVRDDGAIFRSCQIDAEAIGYHNLEDVMDLAALGAPGAFGAVVRWSGEGYATDLGYMVEIWSLVPIAGGGLSVSRRTLARWNGSTSYDEPSRDAYRGWERRFEIVSRGRARLGPRVWRAALALNEAPWTESIRLMAEPPPDERDAPPEILITFDDLGFVPVPASQGSDDEE